ncbi:MAG: hypothetical protein KIS66_08245 [Fimbriimonadaceae bacterium]|nr:hypothetical protein [Fimbriimonadaceae bacterium]
MKPSIKVVGAIAMAACSPLVVPVSVRVVETCADPIERTNHHTLRLHAEREIVSLEDPIIQYESWRRVSPIVYGPAQLGLNHGTSVTDSYTFAQSFTTTTTLGLMDMLSLAVSYLTGVQYGKSVTISKGFSTSYDIPADSLGWIVQRPFAAVRLVKLSKWGDTGYDGFEYAGEYYALSGPELAPYLDFEEGLHCEPLP